MDLLETAHGERIGVIQIVGLIARRIICHPVEGDWVERGVRYGARDIAVMRGYLEGATVLLSSICPSVESFHNAEKGKYRMFVSPRQGEPPAVRVLRRRGLGPITRKAREMTEAAPRPKPRATLLRSKTMGKVKLIAASGSVPSRATK